MNNDQPLDIEDCKNLNNHKYDYECLCSQCTFYEKLLVMILNKEYKNGNNKH